MRADHVEIKPDVHLHTSIKIYFIHQNLSKNNQHIFGTQTTSAQICLKQNMCHNQIVGLCCLNFYIRELVNKLRCTTCFKNKFYFIPCLCVLCVCDLLTLFDQKNKCTIVKGGNDHTCQLEKWSNWQTQKSLCLKFLNLDIIKLPFLKIKLFILCNLKTIKVFWGDIV